MSNYTYESKDIKTPLETYEWDNVWFEHTEIDTPDRVMYIGDSISCVTRKAATAASENKLLFDGFGTSKALDNAYFKESVRIFAAQQGKRRAIVFNNGLHGWHLDDSTEYAEAYDAFVRFLLDEFKGTPVILLLTTHVASPERDKRVVARNDAVANIAAKYSLPTVDLYTPTVENGMVGADGVHLTPDGYKIIAKIVVDAVLATS